MKFIVEIANEKKGSIKNKNLKEKEETKGMRESELKEEIIRQNKPSIWIKQLHIWSCWGEEMRMEWQLVPCQGIRIFFLKFRNGYICILGLWFSEVQTNGGHTPQAVQQAQISL